MPTQPSPTPAPTPAPVVPPLGPLTGLPGGIGAGLNLGANLPRDIAAGAFTVTAAVFGFVASALGHFIVNFVTTLVLELGKLNQAYIIGLVVAVVVVFVLLG